MHPPPTWTLRCDTPNGSPLSLGHHPSEKIRLVPHAMSCRLGLHGLALRLERPWV
jgi:hypothetical protein